MSVAGVDALRRRTVADLDPPERPATSAGGRPRYAVEVRTDHELYWSSYLYCGLYALADRGVVSLSFRPRLPGPRTEVLATVLDVTDRHTGVRRTMAIDWRDNPDVLAPNALAECDLYFKRNYIRQVTLPVCPRPQRHKLRPTGLTFAVRGPRERALWVRVLGGLASHERPLLQPSLRSTLWELYSRVVAAPRQPARLLRQESFEAEAAPEDSRNVVLFQVRSYDPRRSSFPGDTAAVMEQRARIIRALRAALGDRFVGGFVPTPYVLETYPDCVSGLASGQDSYRRLMQSCRICVYSRGLRNSPAFKLAEYLAAGRCVVAEPPATLLPRPLRDGREVLFFGSTGGLVDRCERLLSEPALQRRLARAAKRYYEEEVEPSVRVLDFLESSSRAEPWADHPMVGTARWTR